MSDAFQDFDARLDKIDRKHADLAKGYSAKVTKNGLIVFRPKRRQAGISLRGLLFLAVSFLVFKAIVLASAGGVSYDERLTQLQQGTVVEKAGAFVMQVDPVTLAIAQKLQPYF